MMSGYFTNITPSKSSSTASKVSSLSVEEPIVIVKTDDRVNDSKINTLERFNEYFDAILSSGAKFGSIESESLKKIRPFLLANESASSGSLISMKGKKKKRGKSLKGNSLGENILANSIGKIYTQANPPPAPNLRSADNAPYKLSAFIQATSLFTSSVTVPVFAASNFIINALDNITSLSNIFDQYRISEIETWLEPNSEFANSGGWLYSVVDYDDSTVLSTVPQATDYPNVIVSNSTDGHYHRFTPHVAVASYSGAFTSFANEAAPWIDLSSPSVQHYGLKTAITATAAAVGYYLRARLHCEFRNVR